MLKQNSPISSAHMAAKQACAHEICVHAVVHAVELQVQLPTGKDENIPGLKNSLQACMERLITDSE